MFPLTETKDHRFYDFLFNFALSLYLVLSVVKRFYLQEFLQHIKALPSKVVNW